MQPAAFSIRLARCLDGLAYALLATLAMLTCPPLARTPFGDLNNALLLPLSAVMLTSLAVPLLAELTDRAREIVCRVKIAAVLTVGLAPFVSWWLRAAENLYLTLMAAAACYAAVWYLLELSSFLFELARDSGSARLRLELRVAHSAVFYLALVPVLAVHVSFLIALLTVRGTVLSDLPRTWWVIPWPVRYGMLLPVVHVVTLLWRAAGMHLLRGVTAGPEASAAAPAVAPHPGPPPQP